MIIKHDDLWIVRPDHGWTECFKYSKQAEQALARLLDINSLLTEGKCSEFDFTDLETNDTYEVKFQFKGSVTIEYEQARTSAPSGIATSTADYWLIVNTSATMRGEFVGKVRKYKTTDLKYAVETRKMGGIGDGKVCKFDPRDLPHEWLGDVYVDPTERTWDLTRWKKQATFKFSK